jgi:hypothetical protein
VIFGAHFSLQGLSFFFTPRAVKNPNEGLLKGSTYRPRQINFHHSMGTNTIELTWLDEKSDRAINLSFAKTLSELQEASPPEEFDRWRNQFPKAEKVLPIKS